MGKEEIKYLVRKIVEMGRRFYKVTYTIPQKTGNPIIVEKWARIAVEEGYNDRVTGRPDDKQAEEATWIENKADLKKLYVLTKNEIETRKEEAKTLEDKKSFSKQLMDDIDEKTYVDELSEDNFHQLFYWCMNRLRFLGIDVAHDRYFKSTYLTHEGIPVGSKIVGEKDSDSPEEWGGGE